VKSPAARRACQDPDIQPQIARLASRSIPTRRDGFVCHSFANDDPITCKDYVRAAWGLPEWKPNGGNKTRSGIDIEKAIAAALVAQTRSTAKPAKRIVKTYNYTTADGALSYQNVRLEPKNFLQRRPSSDEPGVWIWGLSAGEFMRKGPGRDWRKFDEQKFTDEKYTERRTFDGVQRVLYRWPELLAYPDATIFVTEGEKDADRLAELGHCATTVASGKWTKDCIEALAGRHCIILQDNDETGRKKAIEAAKALHGVAASIRKVLLPGLPEGGDVSDWFDEAGPVLAAKFVDICLDTPVWRPETEASDADAEPPEQGNDSTGTSEIIACRVSDVEAKPVDWLWDGRIARGKITLVAGEPGLGKSQIAIDLHARLSTGALWPGGGRALVASSMILSAEDAAGDTLRPRLEAAAADLHRVWVLDAVRTKDGKRSFSLQADLDLLGRKITEIGDVTMITIDPITSYMGKIDSHRTTDVRAVLEPLAAFAEQHHVSILAVSHPPKASQVKALHSVTGSLAFVAAARMVFIVVEEPETGRRLFLPIKNNLAAIPAGLGYRLAQRFVSNDILASYVIWDHEPVNVTANQALAEDRAAANGDDAIREAKDFLREALAAGPRPAKDVEKEAKEAGIASRTYDRARKLLKIRTSKGGFTGPWVLTLP
jgi:putative DNA primase/helicase